MHRHAHDHAQSMGRKLQFSLWITVAFIFVEFAGAIKANSLALLSDAGHNLTDSLALALAWGANRLQQKPPTARKTYGYHRAGVLAALLNALLLVGLAIYIFYESYLRLLSPRVVEEEIMILVAAAGLVVNVGVMWVLHGEHRRDLNIRGAYMHMLGDAASSVGIIVGGFVIANTGMMWIDPSLSALIGVLILWSGWDIIAEALNILLEGLPRGLKLEEVCGALTDLDGVVDVHDVHIWSLSSNAHALSCHALIPDLPPSESDAILRRINEVLDERFDIRHTTIQFEHIKCPHAEEICANHPIAVLGEHRH